MLGTGLQFGRVRGEDRFYVPVKARKSQNHKQNHRHHQQQQRSSKPDNDSNNNINRNRNHKSEESDTATTITTTSASNGKIDKEELESNGAVPAAVCRSNLERFLDSTTPSVPAQYFSKTTMRGWRTCDVEFQPYFTLVDLWEFYKEWSAYGAGVPLLLDKSNSVVQYYVPYLSAIQLFGESTSSPSPKLRQAGEDSDGDYYRDSSSDRSSDYEFEKGIKFSRERLRLHLPSDVPFRIGSLSVSDEHSNMQEGFSSDDGEAGNSRRCLLFEFLERDSPYSREPLADKILDLASQYPALNALRSCDLLPGSWMSVAWYPIYRIPTGPTLKDLDACFLTYHSLSTPLEGGGSAPAPVVICPNEFDGVPKISLPVLGMASYKFKGSMWTQNGVSELQLANSLTQAADDWLKSRQVNHPDFQFFASHAMYHR